VRRSHYVPSTLATARRLNADAKMKTIGWRAIDCPSRYGYGGVMIAANISYTRNHLSELIARVREGETLLNMDRNRL
jgi:hypothetical protein